MKGREKTVLSFLVLVCFSAQAQTFAWKSSFDTVPQTGFYAVPLSPQWLAALKTDLSDVRLRDEKERAVPFLIKQPRHGKPAIFVNFPVLKNNTDSSNTTIQIDAGKQTGLGHLELVLGNTAVERRASLSGSNDRRQWFIVDENLFLENSTGYNKEKFVQTLVLPAISYRYLKLKIHNQGTDPLQITAAGVFVSADADTVRETYFKRPAGFQQLDSANGYSYIRINQEADYPVETVWLYLSGPKFYARELKMYRGNRQGTEPMAEARLQSSSAAAIDVQPVKMKSFLVTIENGENPPLKVDSVAVEFRQRTLIAYLEKGKRYGLVGGNPAVAPPAYDLALFRDSIPAALPQLRHGVPVPFEQAGTVRNEPARRWLWPSIAGAVLLLVLLSVQLVRDVERKAK